MAIIMDGGREGFESIGFLPSSRTVKKSRMANYKINRENLSDVIKGLSVQKNTQLSDKHSYYFNTEEITENELSSMIFEERDFTCKFYKAGGAIGMFRIVRKLNDPVSKDKGENG